MTDALLFTATETFQAARRLNDLPPGHRAARDHGHGFRAKVYADLSAGRGDGWGADRGDGPDRPAGTETRALGDALRQVTGALDYRNLNALMPQPGDLELATWLGERLADPLQPGRLRAISLCSTEWQGVVVVPGVPPRAWRRYRFEAAHQLPNVPDGHPCGRMHGHGFEVMLHAECARDDPTGLLGYEALDAAWAPWARKLHHGCLNNLPGLENPTSELLSLWLWQRLQPSLPELRAVTVRETGTAGCCYDGHTFRIWKDASFDSALCFPQLPEVDPWRFLHGHSYGLRLMLSAPLDEVLGWTVDFGDVKALFKPVYQLLDHQGLNDLPGLERPGPGELLMWIRARVADRLPALDGIELNPTPGCGAVLRMSAAADPGLALPAL